ncbi:ABC transporter substrate-binding protein [Rhodopseudomonas pseudopalustris]|uniref:Amino acid/amide ABC transporter substrate-binding protein (HAAT family) n=1 Tax=Rhodopseudomonas faecalis TaxID=99655 RepID=A0A318TIY1_9BRAD|nr:ABC transporter substrate-binding protein [Rhodopseudomonas faecalis]PYF04373.1 amino acid/amide ABC transporter substrate-binding protein (HAAT family) [Rhodopseudomonas faecalis]TAH65045.1 MAG: ABC transporter substrate-binding protein [Rhodopseudomonas palustris]
MSRRMQVLRIVAAGTMAAAISSFSAMTAAWAADTIKIGSVLSMTGPASFLGDPEDKTLKIYVDKINAAGGVDGKKIELVVYDDGGDANKARTFATRLIEDDKVVAMVGGSTTGTTMAMIPVFEEAQIPFISFAGAVEIIDPVRKFVFKTPHTDKMACEKIFENIKQRNFTKIAMISGTDGFGASMRAQCVKVAPAYGVQIVAEETYGPRDSDMTAQLTKIKNTPGIQAVVNPGFGQGPAIVTRNYAQLGMSSTPLYQSHGVASKSFIDLAGAAAEGVRLPAAALLVGDKLPDNDPQKKVVVDYKTTYETTTKQPVSTFGGHAYDGLSILIAAMDRANSSDPKKVRDEIENTKEFVGTGGIVTMSPTDHLGLDLSAFRMLEVKGGDWVLVQPGS